MLVHVSEVSENKIKIRHCIPRFMSIKHQRVKVFDHHNVFRFIYLELLVQAQACHLELVLQYDQRMG